MFSITMPPRLDAGPRFDYLLARITDAWAKQPGASAGARRRPVINKLNTFDVIAIM